jgi:16S rRNA (cytosine967-C5)-methyltransferase
MPPRSERTTDPARATALDVLDAVRDRDAYANLLLPKLLRDRGLTGRDAAFTTELVYGTLRGQGLYDAVIAACVDRDLSEVHAPVLAALRLGAHQLLAMDVPSHAAVSTTVDLVHATSGEGPSRFANAVLRRIGRRDLDTWIAEIAPDPQHDPEGYLATARSHPRWIVAAFWDALSAHRGAERAHTDIDDLLTADNKRPGVTLVVRPGLSDVKELMDLGAEPAKYSAHAAYLTGGDPSALAPVRESRAGVQDEGSQLVAAALAGAPIEGRDERWLDMCAGPGGKAALLAGLAVERGASLLASEIAPHRAGLVRKALRGYEGLVVDRGQGADDAEPGTEPRYLDPGRIQVIAADGIRPPWKPGSFDRVMVDAPCTGLGALRRRPEARWRRVPEDLERLVRVQRRLLSSAIDSVRVGGLVAYVTCSPHLEETRDVVRQVVKARPDVARVDARPYLPGVPDLGGGPDVQLWPHLHGTDAMYLALLRRTDQG